MQETLNRLFKLNQNNRSYAKYFKEVRTIKKDLSREIANIISTRLIQNLNNEILRMLVEDIMNQNIIINNANRALLNLKIII